MATKPESERNESSADRLRRTTTPDAVSADLVSAFAGDREMTEIERRKIQDLARERGDVFFSDLLYAISHHYFPPGIAESLWKEIIGHKLTLSTRLGRNVRIVVAALDYLSNITNEMAAPVLMSESHVSELANLSMRDGMTGLFNHSSCYELLELELRSHRRYGVGVALLVLDVDDFKAVNDLYGHQEGDRVLIEVAKALVAEARDSDICCRLGGDEFGVILRLTNDPVEACDIAERIRVRAATIACRGGPLSLSIGVALCDHTSNSPRALVERADQALYEAKIGGKNRVHWAS